MIKITNDSNELDTRLEDLARYVLKAAWYILGISNFRSYALADGMKNMLWKTRGLQIGNIKNTPLPQLSLSWKNVERLVKKNLTKAVR